mmetsp:Transcript_9839/g.23909  ORF Transcript_9839/g.23909 Transcript_9839/m.23909 type:complete len:102 (-) Transcript_9839:64-369(-)
MTEAEKEAHDEKWSHDNKGQHYGWYPALPYHACFPDMLHMNLNQFNSATEEAYHSHLRSARKTARRQRAEDESRAAPPDAAARPLRIDAASVGGRRSTRRA